MVIIIKHVVKVVGMARLGLRTKITRLVLGKDYGFGYVKFPLVQRTFSSDLLMV